MLPVLRSEAVRDPSDQAPNIAVFADFENVVLGARDAKYPSFDIDLVLQRLLDKGNVVVKKAYCDWDRYRSAVRQLHEAAFELIEIPHVSYSGKNSADIRLVATRSDPTDPLKSLSLQRSTPPGLRTLLGMDQAPE